MNNLIRLFSCLIVSTIFVSTHGFAQDNTGGTWGLSGSAGLGSGYFGLRLTVQYFFNDYLGTSLSGNYNRISDDGDKAVNYGPEAAGIVRIPNSSPVTPYGGAGLGIEFWEREQNNAVFDDSSSLTSLYFVGIGIAVGTNVSLNIQNTWTTYLNTPPRRFGDHSDYESTTRSQIGLGVSISL